MFAVKLATLPLAVADHHGREVGDVALVVCDVSLEVGVRVLRPAAHRGGRGRRTRV